jgi:hypothetical protein
MRGVVLACSGPSLLDIPDLRAPGFPVAAISTAIQCVKDPDYWVFLDRLKYNYGPDKGHIACANHKICKVFGYEKKKSDMLRGFPNVEIVPRNATKEQDAGRTFMDGQPKLIRRPIKSILFAVQYFCMQGFDTLIFAGCELKSKPEKARAWMTQEMKGDHLTLYNRGHNDVLNKLREWHPIAKAKGIRWLSWTPDSPINRFMDRYEPRRKEAHAA